VLFADPLASIGLEPEFSRGRRCLECGNPQHLGDGAQLLGIVPVTLMLDASELATFPIELRHSALGLRLLTPLLRGLTGGFRCQQRRFQRSEVSCELLTQANGVTPSRAGSIENELTRSTGIVVAGRFRVLIVLMDRHRCLA
jgi:hypothetical protein